MLTVAVLRGGPSDEHDISLQTGAALLKHLHREPYRPVDVYVDRSGVWHVRGVPMAPDRALSTVDVAWNALHGQYGESGEVQRLLDRLSVPYTGAGAYGAALSMNKVAAKEVLARAGVRMPLGTTLTSTDDLERRLVELWRTFPQPSVVKPAASGSSVGVTIARSFADFVNGVRTAFNHSAQVVVEQFIKGKEATVAVVDRLRGQKRYALPAVEITPPATCTFFDYSAKYDGQAVEDCPGNFSRLEATELARVATLAHETLNQRHYSRSDFRVTPKGEVYYLETNSAAGTGLTDESLLPKSLAAVGITVSQFVDHVVDLVIHP